MADLGKLTGQTIQEVNLNGANPTNNNLVMFLAQKADEIEPWDGDSQLRDQQLVKLAEQEPFLASAIMSIAMTRAALSWKLTGPPKVVQVVQDILNRADFGNGWQTLLMKVNTDILTTENGGFIEIIREEPTKNRPPETMPVIGIAHLPSLRCIRTGNPLEPVIYLKNDGSHVVLKWWQVLSIVENPVPRSTNGRQFCFVSRVLKLAKILVDIEQHHREKVGGRFNKAIHIVSGPNKSEIENAQKRAEIQNDNAGLLKYGAPIIMTTLDPNARVSKETIELASLPDGFDLDQIMNWYITLFALASGSDYQEFAPLSSGNLGTASQSDTLHRKAQRKGTQLFIKLLENALVEKKIIPPNVAFSFKQQDAQAELELAEISHQRAETRALMVQTGEITPEIARQMAVASGDLRREYLIDQEGEPDILTLGDDEAFLEAKEIINIQEGKNIPFKTAQIAAKLFIEEISKTPLQNISPIPEQQLALFEEYLTKMLKTTKRIGIEDNGWPSLLLIEAFKETGGNPLVLKERLPKRLSVTISENQIWKNGKIVYTKPIDVKDKSQVQVENSFEFSKKDVEEQICYQCKENDGEEVVWSIYGWSKICPSCLEKENAAFTLPDNFNKKELLEVFRKKIKSSSYKNVISFNLIKFFEEHGLISKEKASELRDKIKIFVSNPEALILNLLNNPSNNS